VRPPLPGGLVSPPSGGARTSSCPWAPHGRTCTCAPCPASPQAWPLTERGFLSLDSSVLRPADHVGPPVTSKVVVLVHANASAAPVRAAHICTAPGVHAESRTRRVVAAKNEIPLFREANRRSAHVDQVGAALGHLGEDLAQGALHAADALDLLGRHLTGVDAPRSERHEEGPVDGALDLGPQLVALRVRRDRLR
jgi:hypothetical protein